MKDNIYLMMELAKEMDEIASTHCADTSCTDDRMKSVHDEANCTWYHAGWLYCRLADIIISKDYLQLQYIEFFKKRAHCERLDILICGFADYAILNNILAVVPDNMIEKVHFTMVDICQSPIELCKSYIKMVYPALEDRISYLRADATSIPLENGRFDLITTYSFLTRMTKPLMQRVLAEWFRLLNVTGEILTTVHITTQEDAREGFETGSSASVEFGEKKVEKFLATHEVGSDFAAIMRKRTTEYLTNIMSSTLINTSVIEAIQKYPHNVWYYDQPGELEAVHKMMGIQVQKGG